MAMRTVGDWNEEGKSEAAALEELLSVLVETVSGQVRELTARLMESSATAVGCAMCTAIWVVEPDGEGRMRPVPGLVRYFAAVESAADDAKAMKRSAKKLCRRLLEEGRLHACCGGPARARGNAPRRPDTSPSGAATSNTQNIVLWCATNTNRASGRNGPVSTLLRRVGAAPRDGA